MQPPDEIAYVVGGPCNLTTLRVFVERYNTDWTKEDHEAWEKDNMTTMVRAIADPKSDMARICGVLLFGCRRRHIQIEHVLVEPELRRRRIASNMFYSIVLDTRFRRYATISAIVPDNNDAGIGWLKNTCFRAISVMPGKNGERDQYLFSWSWDHLNKALGGEDAKSVDPGSVVLAESAGGGAAPDATGG